MEHDLEAGQLGFESGFGTYALLSLGRSLNLSELAFFIICMMTVIHCPRKCLLCVRYSRSRVLSLSLFNHDNNPIRQVL